MLALLPLLLAANGSNPAYADPSPLWGELKPTDLVTIAAARDHSAFDEASQPFAGAKLTVAVEAWNGALLEVTNSGFGVWDLSTPKNPPRVGSLATFPKVPTGTAANVFGNDVAAPPAGSNLAVLALGSGAGVVFINVATRASPQVIYQDGDPADGNARSCRDAYTASIGGKPYAFVACAGPAPGVVIYDLAAAALIPIVYQEVTPNPGSTFPNVFVGAGKLVSSWMDMGVSKPKSVTRLDGVESFIVTNAALGGGFDLWNVSTVGAPRRVGGGANADFVGPVVMWKTGERYFVAALTSTELQFYEVTRQLKETSTAPATLLRWLPATRAYDAETRLQYSRAADGSDLVSYASAREPAHDASSFGLTAEEAIYDVTDPLMPRDLTPLPQLVNGVQTGYWSYGYQFGWVRPLGGRFAGSFFYRAAFGILDIHQWTPPLNRAPVITSTPVTAATVGRAYDYQIVASDPEGKALTYEKTAGPTAMEFLAPGEVSWVPAAADLGSHPVTVTVSDGRNPVQHSWTLVVSAVATDAGSGAGGGAGGLDGGFKPPPTPKGGCGCQTGAAPMLLLVLLGVLAKRRNVLQLGGDA